jgi:hypothetical protein
MTISLDDDFIKNTCPACSKDIAKSQDRSYRNDNICPFCGGMIQSKTSVLTAEDTNQKRYGALGKLMYTKSEF